MGARVIERGADFYQAVERAGPAGQGQPLVLQAPQARPAQAAPRRDRAVRHDPGQPVVRVVEPGRARRGEPEPEQPAPAQHLADPELARARGLALPLVARAPVQRALRPGVRAARLLPLPGHARERVGGAPHDPPRARGAVGGVPRTGTRPARASPRSSRTGGSGGGRRSRGRWPSSAGRTTSRSRTRAASRRTARRPGLHGGRRRRPRHPSTAPPAHGRRRRAARGLRRPRGHGLPRLGRDEPLARAGAGGPGSSSSAHYRANVGRGVHRLSQLASERYWLAREKVARFVNGGDGTLVFTRNTTEAVELVAHGLPWAPGDRVVTTVLEHHSNLLPWLRLRERGVEVVVVDITRRPLPRPRGARGRDRRAHPARRAHPRLERGGRDHARGRGRPALPRRGRPPPGRRGPVGPAPPRRRAGPRRGLPRVLGAQAPRPDRDGRALDARARPGAAPPRRRRGRVGRARRLDPRAGPGAVRGRHAEHRRRHRPRRGRRLPLRPRHGRGPARTRRR